MVAVRQLLSVRVITGFYAEDGKNPPLQEGRSMLSLEKRYAACTAVTLFAAIRLMLDNALPSV